MTRVQDENEVLSETELQIYNIIKSNPEKMHKPADLVKKTNLSARKIRIALKKLENKDLILKRPDFLDLRSYYYYASESTNTTEQSS
jgi:DNA-binding MarR family transcriptional regulator